MSVFARCLMGVGAYLVSGLLMASDRPYREPDFQVILFDRDSLTLGADAGQALGHALTALALNFPGDEEVTSRARAMGLLLAFHLREEDREIVVGNYHLRRGLRPLSTEHFREKAEVIRWLESTLQREAVTPEDEVLQALLMDVLDEIFGRERSRGEAWKGAVSPAERSLAQDTASVRLFKEDGRVLLVRAQGVVHEAERPEIAILANGRRWDLAHSLQEDLEKRYPYLARHLELTLSAPKIEEDETALWETGVPLMMAQLSDGWQWDERCALMVAGNGARGGGESMVLAIEKLIEANETPPSTVFVPDVPIRAFLDWMALEEMHQALDVQLISLGDLDDVMAWHREEAESSEVTRRFSRLRASLEVATKKGWLKREHLRSRPEVMRQLALLREGWPQHLSANVLWSYAQLDAPVTASLAASCRWLKELAAVVMPLSAGAYTEAFANRQCAEQKERLRRVSPHLHGEAQGLAMGLHRFIDRRAIPFTRVRKKSTSTARRQFKQLVSAIAEWHQRLKDSSPGRRAEND